MTCHSSGRSPIIAIGLGALVDPSRIRMPRPPQNRTTFMRHLPLRRRAPGSGRRACRPSRARRRAARDLVAQVPRQDQDVVGPVGGDALRRVDRDVRARQEHALLVRAAVDGVLEQVLADAAVVEQRVALARGAVADDPLALGARRQEEVEQVALDREDLVGEAVVPLEGVQPGGGLGVEDGLDREPRLTGAVSAAGRAPAATRRACQLLDVDDASARPWPGPGTR